MQFALPKKIKELSCPGAALHPVFSAPDSEAGGTYLLKPYIPTVAETVAERKAQRRRQLPRPRQLWQPLRGSDSTRLLKMLADDEAKPIRTKLFAVGSCLVHDFEALSYT